MWYTTSYRRNLVDMHIEDWDPSFLSQYDPKAYVELLLKAKVQTAMVYANSHVGYCYWPTETGHMHRGIQGRDVLGEFVDYAHEAGMDVVLYYSLIFNNWLSDQHPSWRMVDVEGRDGGTWSGRYGVCCPNVKEHRQFVVDQVAELCHAYTFEGLFYDMAFWPRVCYCAACQQRFADEVGGELPRVVDWTDSRWTAFQHKREEWLVDFAGFATETAKQLAPEISVEHNSASFTHPWRPGTTLALRDCSDFIGGDLYGGFFEQSFVCKFYDSITRNKPFEYMTSRCDPFLANHTTTKTKDQLQLHNYLTLAHHGAFLFIDAIDPVGTLNPAVYETMGEIFAESQEYEPYLGGTLCADAAVYFSMDSKMDRTETGSPLATGQDNLHLTAALGAARVLKEWHIPFTVASQHQLDALEGVQVLILPALAVLHDAEKRAIVEFVRQGGGLYVSGAKGAELLADLLHIGLEHDAQEYQMTYMAPTERGEALLPGVSRKYPLSIPRSQVKVRAHHPEEVMATLALPYTTRPEERFASIHSNPPGLDTEYAAVIQRQVGKGKVIWTADPIEQETTRVHQTVFRTMVEQLMAKPRWFAADAPAAVEVLLHHQGEKNRYLVTVVNEQEQVPPIPVYNAKVRVRIGDQTVHQVLRLPDETPLPFSVEGDWVEVTVHALSLFAMLAIDYEIG